MSQRGLLYADGHFPFQVWEKYRNESGVLVPFSAWDGSTVHEVGTIGRPSALASRFVPVTGPATNWPVGLTLAQFSVFFWRVRKWKMTVDNIDELALTVDSVTAIGSDPLVTAAGGTADPGPARSESTVRLGENAESNEEEEYIFHELSHQCLIGIDIPSKHTPMSGGVESSSATPAIGISLSAGGSAGYGDQQDSGEDGEPRGVARTDASVFFSSGFSFIGDNAGFWPALKRDGLYYPYISGYPTLNAWKLRLASTDGDPGSDITEAESLRLLGTFQRTGDLTSYESTFKLKLMGDTEVEFAMRYWSSFGVLNPFIPATSIPTTVLDFPMPRYVIEPLEYWSCGGIYDTTTGEPV